MMMKIENPIRKLLYFLAVITTIVAATTSLSRFESATAGTSETEVAAFIIDVSGESGKSVFDLNGEKTTDSYSIEVANQKDQKVSGVSIKYDIELEFDPALPIGMTISDGTITLDTEEGKEIYIFEEAGKFTAGNEASNTHTITIAGNIGELEEYCGEMSIYVDAAQID